MKIKKEAQDISIIPTANGFIVKRMHNGIRDIHVFNEMSHLFQFIKTEYTPLNINPHVQGTMP